MSYMNYRPPGSSNYTNGTSNHLNGDGRLRRFDFDTTPDDSAEERSRSRGQGGYGGFVAPAHSAAQHVQGLPRVNRQHAHRRSRDDDAYSASRSRSRPGVWVASGRGGREVDELLRYISQQWSVMASDACVPVKVALQLMDPSSLGLQDQYDSFQRVHQQLQNALKVIVNEHHQGFNSSIGTFHKIQQAIQASQHRVRALRAGLVQAKGSLGQGRPELKAFAMSSQRYDSMLHTLATIEQLQLVPERLEAQISEKRFLGAVTTLQEALALIRQPELDDIGALSDLRVYLSNQEHSLTDILIEELHSHLYLKSPYCEERWKGYVNDALEHNVPTAGLEDANRAMYTFLDTLDVATAMQEDTTRNPEANTFDYIRLLVESLSQLSKLETAVDAIEQRLPIELFRVVERSHSEVEQRHPSTMWSAARTRLNKLDLIDSMDAERSSTLQDLLQTLYAKFEAIAEGHRVLHDITAAILKREQHTGEDAALLNRSFRELWKLLQSEIRSLLHDHLATNASAAGAGRRENDSSANIFRPQPRDKNRKLFKLSDTDSRATALAMEREDLEFILRSSVPGLVNRHDKQHISKGGRDDAGTMATDRSATGHKLLVEPSVFNMSILLPPSLSFLTRLRDIVPPHSGVVASTLTSFLDDFLINVFYPQLDETLLDLSGKAMDDLEAFQIDPISTQKYSSRPVFNGTIRFFEVIELVCGMLDALPHEQSFSALVITQIRNYYDKCYNWSKSVLQRAMAQEGGGGALRMRLAADLATDGDVNDVVVEMFRLSGEGNENERLVLAEKEAALLIQFVKKRKLDEADLINGRKALTALATLHVSVKWLAARCSQLRYISPRAIDMGSANTPSSHSRRWTQNVGLDSPTTPSDAVYLPLDQSTAAQFDAVLLSFTELSTLILRTLHIDLRMHLLHGIYTALDTTYELRQPYNDPDPAILNLSNSLSTYTAAIFTHLLPPQTAFLTSQLDILVNSALVGLVGCVSAMDAYGNSRMQLNVLVLQQSLKNVQPSASLERAARFYELGEQGPEAVVSQGKGEGYEKGDLKALVRLCYNRERDAVVGGVDEFVARLG